jgi:hypothetical protein
MVRSGLDYKIIGNLLHRRLKYISVVLFKISGSWSCMQCHNVVAAICRNTGHTQKNGAVLIVFTIKTAPLFYVCPV